MLWSILFVALLGNGTGMSQQELTLSDLGRIADVVLDTIVPVGGSLGRVPTAERGIRFDAALTDQSVRGVPSSKATPAELGMRREVTAGTKSLTANCDQMGLGLCEALGRNVYIWMDRVAEDVEPGQLRVRVHVTWAQEAPPNRNRIGPFRTGFSTTVKLVRTSAGGWKVVEVGSYAAG